MAVSVIWFLNERWDGKRQNLQCIHNSFFQFIEQSIALLSCFCLSIFFIVKKDVVPGVLYAEYCVGYHLL